MYIWEYLLQTLQLNIEHPTITCGLYRNVPLLFQTVLGMALLFLAIAWTDTVLVMSSQ